MSIFFQRIYLGCLAQASYLIGSGGEAAIVDPRRDIDDYVELAARQGLRIGSVFLTHAHADFVAGHSELAARGARIHTGRRAECGFERVPLRDGDKVGSAAPCCRCSRPPGTPPTASACC
jgi:glyoxylase-like metal-dependent hydrolase (beta-lactamase superfamily II)